jgi:hypothetical protein
MSAAPGFTASCTCGKVAIAAAGTPILSAACYCESCRTAARRFEQAPGAPAVLNPDGAIDYCLFRKDRVRILRGHEHLRTHRLTDNSPTRRVVASCCNAPMMLDFTRGHWLTLYRDRITGDAPQIEMGVMAKDRPADHAASSAPPSYRAYPAFPARFMIRLMLAWAAMRFRKTALDW